MIVALALTLNLAGNGRTGLWDRDEPRYATCTREMIGRGDWLRPTFNDQPRYHKPVLIYWLMRGGVALGGDNPFGARLVSALAGVGTVLLTWGLGRSLFGPNAGRLAAGMLATAPIVVVESKLATTDATLAFFVVAGMACLWRLSKSPSAWVAAGFWTSMALATLTKGPIGLALVAAAGGVSWWWGGPALCWSRLRWQWGPALFVLLTAPWYVAIGLASRGEFYRFAMGAQGLGRLTGGVEQHGAPPGYYAALSAVLFYPWSALLPAAILGAWSRRKLRPEFGFLLGWTVGPWLLLETVPTKLIHYYLPAFPACALLAAWLVGAVAAEGASLRRWPLGRLAFGLLAGLGGAFVVALAGLGLMASWSIPGMTRLPTPMAAPSLASALAMAIGLVLALTFFQRGRAGRGASTLVATWALVMAIVGAGLFPAAEPLRISRVVGERLALASRTSGAVAMVGNFQPPGIIYALGHPAPVIARRDDLIRQVRQHPAVVALLDWEVEQFRDDPRLAVRVVETVRGVDMEKARPKTLRLTVLRSSSSTAATETPGEDFFVK